MQGKSVAIIDVRDKIQGFWAKLYLRTRGVQQGIYANLLAFDDWKVNKSRNDFSDLEVEICKHLAVLKTSSESYFDGAIFEQ